MGNFLRGRWAVAAASVLFAIILSAYVYGNVEALSTSQNNAASVMTTKEVADVPIKIVDSSNKKYVSGLPEKVTVQLSGPRNLLAQLTDQTLIVETQDVAALDNGIQTVQLHLAGLPSQVSGVVSPLQTNVTIQDLVTKEVAVKGIVPEGNISAGYQVGNITVNPEKVILSGSEKELEKVASVTATVPITSTTQTQTFTQNNVKVVVKDASDNILDVKASKNVSVTVQLIVNQQNADIDVVLSNQLDGKNYIITHQSHYQTAVVNTIDGAVRLNALIDVSKLDVGTHTVNVPVLTTYGVTLTQLREISVTISVTDK